MNVDGEEVGEELTIKGPRTSRSLVLQICGIVEFASLSGVRVATALGIANAGVGS